MGENEETSLQVSRGYSCYLQFESFWIYSRSGYEASKGLMEFPETSENAIVKELDIFCSVVTREKPGMYTVITSQHPVQST